MEYSRLRAMEVTRKRVPLFPTSTRKRPLPLSLRRNLGCLIMYMAAIPVRAEARYLESVSSVPYATASTSSTATVIRATSSESGTFSRSDDEVDDDHTWGSSSNDSSTPTSSSSSTHDDETDESEVSSTEDDGSTSDSAGDDSSDQTSIDSSSGHDGRNGTFHFEVLTPSEGDELFSDNFHEVIWEYSGSSEDHCPRFFIDLYSCKENTTSSGADCGEFARELCSEEGCLSHHGAAWVYLPLMEVYHSSYTVVVSPVTPANGTFPSASSGRFSIAVSSEEDELESSTETGSSQDDGSHRDDDDDSADDDDITSSHYEYGQDSAINSTSSTKEANVSIVSLSCSDLDEIPSDLGEDFEIIVVGGNNATVAELVCDEKTVTVPQGTVTIFSEIDLVFRGVRFDVPAGAELIVHADGNIVFTGITDYQSSGGVFSIAEGGSVDITGFTTFQDNTVQSVPGELRNGGAISNKGRLRLRSGASFFDNGTGSHGDHVYAGDGGAIWNGNSGTMHIWGVVEVAGNMARGGGNGGGVYNEGVLHFHDDVFFEANLAEGGADGGEGNGGLGGAILNVGGEVRFYGEAEFYHNKAKAGSAIVNTEGGKIVMHEVTKILDNVSQEDDGSDAGAAWNQEGSVLWFRSLVSWERNRGYNAGALLNDGKTMFRGDLNVQDNSALMDGGGFVNGPGANMIFEGQVDFLANVATGSGGAILNHATLRFRHDDNEMSLLFEDNYCGESECQDIQNKNGSSVKGLDDVLDLCEIGSITL